MDHATIAQSQRRAMFNASCRVVAYRWSDPPDAHCTRWPTCGASTGEIRPHHEAPNSGPMAVSDQTGGRPKQDLKTTRRNPLTQKLC
jgi:hypothetical protein